MINSRHPISRLGINYFPDTFHYRVLDLEKWIPELVKMGMHWLGLVAPAERAIPDYFINGLMASDIQPIPQFYLQTNRRETVEDMRVLFKCYAHWGINEIALFDRPNLRSNWRASEWTHSNLVENFLDYFIPLAAAAVDEGLTVIFPPLEPGGDYWDLSFLQSALQGLIRRCRPAMIQNIAFGAHAWHGEHSVDWGKGGSERWPEARPYQTPPGSEDHRGFRIFEWYSEIIQRELGEKKPIYLLRAGPVPQDSFENNGQVPNYGIHSQRCLEIAERMYSQNQGLQHADAISDDVVACNFWLLTAHEGSRWVNQAWFQPDCEPLPVVRGFYRLAARSQILTMEKDLTPAQNLQAKSFSPQVGTKPIENQASEGNSDDRFPDATGLEEEEPEKETEVIGHFGISMSAKTAEPVKSSASLSGQEEQFSHQPAHIPSLPSERIFEAQKTTPISHYVLLPLYAWGAADWDLSIIQPMLNESHPTIGFSLDEARFAQRVTVIGGEGALSKDALAMLQANGCYVERVLDDGTLVAS